MGDLSGNPRVPDHVYYPVTLSVPASTPASAPVTSLPFTSDKYIESIEVEVPPGHSGLTGIAVTYDGVNIVPWSASPAWVTADNYVKEFDVGMVMGPQFTIAGYNTDVFTHTFYVRVKVRNSATAAAAQASSAAPATSATVAAAAPITQLAPLPQPTEVPPMSMLATLPAVDASTVDVVALYNQVQAMAHQIEALQAEVATLSAAQQVGPGPSPVSAVSPVSGAPSTPPSGPTVTLPPAGGTVTLPSGEQVNPYQPSGALDITAVGKIIGAQGGSGTIITPTGAQLPVTVGTLGGHPYTCIGTSC